MPTVREKIQEVRDIGLEHLEEQRQTWAGSLIYYVDYLDGLLSDEEKRKEAPANFNIFLDQATTKLKLQVETAIHRDAEFMALPQGQKEETMGINRIKG